MGYICKHCGIYVDDKDAYGSGKFCSRACANSRVRSSDTRLKISQGLKKQTICKCQFCGKELKSLASKSSHERLCENNPNRIPNNGAVAKHNKKLNNLYKT